MAEGFAFSARQQLAARVRRRLRVHRDQGPAHRHQGNQARHGERRSPWTACCAATSASARPKSSCARRSRRWATASRWPCSRRPPCSAFQHFETFKRRFQPFPVRIEMLSRFRTPKEIKAVLAELAEGKVDIAIGTHRLLSQGRRVPGPGPADRGRRAALRRQPQRAAQADEAKRGCAHHERHADSAHAAHVAAGPARHVRDRDAAQGSPGDPDRGGAFRSGADQDRRSSRN